MQRQLLITTLFAIAVASCAPRGMLDNAEAAPALSAFEDPVVSVRSPMDPPQPMQLGGAPDAASAAQLEALWWVNTYRTRAGLGPVDQLRELNDAADAHAQFVLLNPALYEGGNLSVHEEAENHDGFYGERFWERMKRAGYKGQPFREVIAYQSKPAAAVAHWMETVYHRLPLLHPSAKHVGYAERSLGKSRINVLDLGSGDGEAPMVPGGIVWPPDGATGVPVAWDGLESPQPPAPESGYPSGPVITLTFGQGADFEVIQSGLRAVGASKALKHVLLTPQNDPHLDGESSLALYANNPLEHGVTYEVMVRGVADGAEFVRKWTFTTRDYAGCSLLGQDCGTGQACYGTSDNDAVCAWSGIQTEGDNCNYQNDCDGGLTCAAGQCRRYCTLGDSAWSCDATCQGGHSTINASAGLGVCAAPQSE